MICQWFRGDKKFLLKVVKKLEAHCYCNCTFSSLDFYTPFAYVYYVCECRHEVCETNSVLVSIPVCYAGCPDFRYHALFVYQKQTAFLKINNESEFIKI